MTDFSPHLGWVRAIARTNRVPVQWDRVALSAAGITAPIGTSILIAPHSIAVLGMGALASMGALVASLMDLGSAGIERVHRMLLGTLMASLGFAIGTLAYGHSIVTFFVVVAAAAVSGASGAVSTTASKSGLYFLMFTVTAANTDFGLSPPALAPLIFLSGALWRLLLTVVVAALVGRRLSPERRAVAQVYTVLADQLAAPVRDPSSQSAAVLSQVLDDAHDVMVAARTRVVDRDARWHTLVALLNGAGPLVTAVIGITDAAQSDTAHVGRYLRGIGNSLRNPSLPLPVPPEPDQSTPEQRALGSALRSVLRVTTRSRQNAAEGTGGTSTSLLARPTVVHRLRSAHAALSSSGELQRAVLRLVLCMAVAQTLSLSWHLERPYLVMLTIAQIMKPDFGSVFARAVQRGLGTLLGVAVGSLVILLLPHGIWQILVIALLAAIIPIAKAKNYGLYAIVSTPLSVILVEMHVGASQVQIDSRLLDTLLGCALVLVLGYLIWPSTWHAPQELAQELAQIPRAIGRYVEVAFPPGQNPRAADPAPRSRATEVEITAARRDTTRLLTDLRTRIDQSLAEPPAISAAAVALVPEIDALEQVADTVTATVGASSSPADPDVVLVRNALDDLASAIATRSAPGAAPLPSEGPLANVGAEITAARSAVSRRFARTSHAARPGAARRR